MNSISNKLFAKFKLKYIKCLYSSTHIQKPIEKIELFINNEPVLADPGMTILQACALIGIEIPRYCYHERLSIAGNCRMCLVEVEKSAKPVASCAMPIMKGMRVKTDTRSDITRRAREGVTEFLLVNHPLDCPICDQAGECDLQDQTMAFGTDRSRFIDINFTGKRAVEDKNIGPLVKTSMNRCIHCTKCIRFASEIAGVDDLGTTGRGSDMQVGTFVEKMFYSELSGNVIDLCPVGALTSKPYSFQARPWETRKTESVDVMDGLGSNIVVSTRAGNLYRILPKVNEDINEEWISDKTRFAYDGLQYQRLATPMIKNSKGSLIDTDWEHALNVLAHKFTHISGDKIMGVVGTLCDTESIAALKELFHRVGSNHLYSESIFPTIFTDYRSSYLLNNGIARIEESDFVLIIGCNPRLEAPILNARIRKGWLNNELDVAYIGDTVNLSYEYNHVGTDINSLLNLFMDSKNEYRQRLKNAKKPLIILGYTALKRADGEHIQKVVLKLSQELQKDLSDPDWKIYNVLHTTANLVGALDLKLHTSDCTAPLLKNKPQLVYLLGSDENTEFFNTLRKYKEENSNVAVVYQGHHGDAGAALADIVLPGAAYTEKYGTFVNTEGRSQYTQQAVSPPGRAKEDWKIIRALSEFMDESFTSIKLKQRDPLSSQAEFLKIPLALRQDTSREATAITTSGPVNLRNSKQSITLPFDDILQARNLMNRMARSIHLTTYGHIDARAYRQNYEALMEQIATLDITESLQKLKSTPKAYTTLKPAMYTLKDFYMTNTITRASVTMAKCVKAASEAEKSAFFTQPQIALQSG